MRRQELSCFSVLLCVDSLLLSNRMERLKKGYTNVFFLPQKIQIKTLHPLSINLQSHQRARFIFHVRRHSCSVWVAEPLQITVQKHHCVQQFLQDWTSLVLSWLT